MKGFREIDDPQKADYIIINSCGFIEDALNETIEETLLISRKKKNKSKIILTGCAANLYKKEFKDNLIEADYIFDYDEFYSFFNIFSYEKTIDRKFNNEKWQYLLISEGCSKFCTYCTIPLIKGPYRSFELANLTKEVRQFKDKGIEEIILISQDTANYGKDLYNETLSNPLDKLIEEITLQGINKIRLLYFNLDSIETKDKFKFIENIYSKRGIVPYFEIPVQHLVDNILQRMGRRIKYSEIQDIFKKIKNNFPHSVIRTSIITGFPGEKEEDYLLLKDRLLSLPIDYLNVFAYSDMEKAPSYKLNDKVKPEKAIERRNDLQNEFEKLLDKKFERFIGYEDEIFIEDEDEAYYIGRSWMQAPEIDGLTYLNKNNTKNKDKKYKRGEKIKIKINESFLYDLYGEII